MTAVDVGTCFEKDVFTSQKGCNISFLDILFDVVKNDLPWPKHENETTTDTTDNVKQDGYGEQNVIEVDKMRKKVTPPKEGSANSTFMFWKENLSNIFKAHFSRTEKPSGTPTDIFERIFTRSLQHCDQSDVLSEDCTSAFTMILTGEARKFYLDIPRSKNPSFEYLANSVKSRFHMTERRRDLLQKWDSISLNVLMSNSPDKSPSNFLEHMIARLSDIQTSLPEDNQCGSILPDKLLNAVRVVSDCRLTYHKQPDSV